MKPYWLDSQKPYKQDPFKSLDDNQELIIVGGGVVGSCLAYLLSKSDLFKKILIVDYKPENAASFRNAGHILAGTAESAHALNEIYGKDLAEKIWKFTTDSCDSIKRFCQPHQEEVDYAQTGQYCIAIDDNEAMENVLSCKILEKWGYKTSLEHAFFGRNLGLSEKIKNIKFDPLAARANPVKYRNLLLEKAFKTGKVRYQSNIKVIEAFENPEKFTIVVKDEFDKISTISSNYGIVATNAYTPLIFPELGISKLITPFRGQIIGSKRFKSKLSPLPWSPMNFNHGYEYALKTEDNRLILGGWRDNISGMEQNQYSLEPNPEISQGLENFAKNYFSLGEDLEWEYEWAGIMASVHGSLPIVGPVGDRMWAVISCGGHGFSLHRASCELLTKIILGEDYDKELAALFSPNKL